MKILGEHGKNIRRLAIAGACAAMSLMLIMGAEGQQTGPLHPPPPPPTPLQQPTTPKDTVPSQGTPTSASTPGPTSGPTSSTGKTTTPATLGPPPMPIPELIQKFAARESALKEARGNYTYTQKVMLKDYGPGGEEGGTFQQTSDIVFTPEGKRYEKVTYAPVGQMVYIQMTAEDFKDIEDVQPFVLTAEELPKYNVTYLKHEPVDELTCYVFEVTPKVVEKNQAYFSGKIWVEDQGFNIVKSYGRAMHGIKAKKGSDGQLFPQFETIRENITADLWFPTYTHADDVLHFKTEDLRIVMTIRYSNYKYFGSTIKISPSKTDHEELREPPKP